MSGTKERKPYEPTGLPEKKGGLAALLRVLFAVSGAAMTFLVSLRGPLWQVLIGAACSFFILCVLAFRHRMPERFFRDGTRAQLGAAVALSLFADYWYAVKNIGRFRELLGKDAFPIHIPERLLGEAAALLSAAAGIAALFAAAALLHFFIVRLSAAWREWIRAADRAERIFLIAGFAALAVAVVVIFNLTDVFYAPGPGGAPINYDVVYTTDSGALVSTNVYLNVEAPENDIRQPLFGLFSMPFALVASAASTLLFFVPNAHPIAMNLIQIALLLISLVSVARMLRLPARLKMLVLVLLAACYPTLLFALNMEQYIFPVFWLVSLIYAHLFEQENRALYYLAASGSLLTSAVAFPLLARERTFAGFARRVAGAWLGFAATLVVFGQLPLVLTVFERLRFLMRFTGAEVGAGQKLLQYLNFVASCFVRPAAGVSTTAYPFISYQLDAVRGVNFAGVAFLAAALAGFAANYRDRFAQICLGWIGFSFLMLCAVGWGTRENGLILYTLYFSWAFFALAVLLVEKALARHKKARYVVYSAAAVALLCANLPGIHELIEFGIRNYPAN